MSEQVMRSVGLDGREYVPADDYDALHAEAEALRAENGRLAESMRVAHHNLSVGFDTEASLTSQLEAARGLLRDIFMTCNLREMPSEYAIRDISNQIEALLTATPAPEVQAEHGERQEALPLFTCAGKGGEYAKLGYAKPAGAIKAIQGDSGLIIYRDTNGGQLYFRDPRDFKERMSPLAVMEPCSLGGDVIRQRTTADATPQPGPDMRGLLEAGNPLSNAAYNLAQKQGHALTEYECDLLSELRKRWDKAVLASSQAQRQA